MFWCLLFVGWHLSISGWNYQILFGHQLFRAKNCTMPPRQMLRRVPRNKLWHRHLKRPRDNPHSGFGMHQWGPKTDILYAVVAPSRSLIDVPKLFIGVSFISNFGSLSSKKASQEILEIAWKRREKKIKKRCFPNFPILPVPGLWGRQGSRHGGCEGRGHAGGRGGGGELCGADRLATGEGAEGGVLEGSQLRCFWMATLARMGNLEGDVPGCIARGKKLVVWQQ